MTANDGTVTVTESEGGSNTVTIDWSYTYTIMTYSVDFSETFTNADISALFGSGTETAVTVATFSGSDNSGNSYSATLTDDGAIVITAGAYMKSDGTWSYDEETGTLTITLPEGSMGSVSEVTIDDGTASFKYEATIGGYTAYSATLTCSDISGITGTAA